MLIQDFLTPEEFKEYRYAMGYSLQEIANEFCVTKQSICNLEAGTHISDATLQYYTLGIKILWDRIPDDEKAWRLECGKQGVNTGVIRNKRVVEYIKRHTQVDFKD